MRKQLHIYWITIMLVCLLGQIGLADDLVIKESMLPSLWSINKVYYAPQNQLVKFSEKLGGEVTEIRNYFLDIGGLTVRVNIIESTTTQEAEKIYSRLQTLSNNHYQITERYVIEYIGKDIFIKKVKDILGLYDDEEVVYQVKFGFTPIAKIEDEMKWNDLFNLLSAYQRDQKDESQSLKAKIDELKPLVTFSNKIFLRTGKHPWGSPQYTFSVPLVKSQTRGDITFFTLETQATFLDIPFVEVEAEIPVKPFSSYLPEDPIDFQSLTCPTSRWPVDHPEIQKIVQHSIRPGSSTAEKVEDLLGWIHLNMQYGGKMGARYGVEQVLVQKFGRCMDFADLMITLCRNAGVPARFIIGWVPSLGGHSWVEVYIPEEGWVGVDPTTTWLGVSEDYIPFVISESGEIPFVYWGVPEIGKVDSPQR